MEKRIIFVFIIFIFLFFNTYSGQWIKVDDNFNYYYRGLECLDSLNCAELIEKGAQAYIRVTNDGGQIWNTTLLDTGNVTWLSQYEFSFCTVSGYGYKAVLDSGDYWESFDKGLTWKYMRYRDSAYKIFDCEIKFYNEDRGAILERQDIYITTNGGNSWSRVPIDKLDTNSHWGSLISLSIPTDNTIMILAYKIVVQYQDDSTYIIRSDDFGKTWITCPVLGDHQNGLDDIFFFDSLRGWAVGMPKQNTNIRRDVIKYTSDGGYSWKYQLDTIMGIQPGGLSEVTFYDDSTGVAIGQNYHMWKTTNGGRNWFIDTSYHNKISGGNISDYFKYITYMNKNILLAAERIDGGIYKYIDETVGIEEHTPKDLTCVFISPNPASDYIEIQIPDNRWVNTTVGGDNQIRIYNSLGECVISVEAIHEPIDRRSQLPLHRLDISALSPGLYFININNGKEILTGGFIVMR